MQYTVRNISRKVDQALRKKAREQARSLNDVLVEALSIMSGVQEPVGRVKRRDLSDIAGSWVEDPEFDKIMREQDQVDPRDWR